MITHHSSKAICQAEKVLLGSSWLGFIWSQMWNTIVGTRCAQNVLWISLSVSCFMKKNGYHSSRTNVWTFSSENKLNLNGNSFSALDNPLIRSRILSEIDALTNASHVVTVYAHVQNHVTSRKENGGQPQATVYLLQDEKKILSRSGCSWEFLGSRSQPLIKELTHGVLCAIRFISTRLRSRC